MTGLGAAWVTVKSLSLSVDLLPITVSLLAGFYTYAACGELCIRNVLKLMRPVVVGPLGDLLTGLFLLLCLAHT